MNSKAYEYDAVIQSSEVGKGGAYVVFPYDIRMEFGKGRIKVHATFDGEPYDGSIVNMGVKNEDGSVCYIIGILKNIRMKIGKRLGDTVCTGDYKGAGLIMAKATYQFEDFLSEVNPEYKRFVTETHEKLQNDGYKIKVESKASGFFASYSHPKAKQSILNFFF